MEHPKFQVFKSAKDQQFYFRLKAKNGEIVLSSEGYTSKQNCFNGIDSVKANAAIDSLYEKDDLNGFTFNLKATNGEIIGKSESYTTAAAREHGIVSVKNAAGSRVEDLT